MHRHRALIAGCSMVCATVAALVTARMTPGYEASASIRIDPDDSRLVDLGIAKVEKPSEIPTEFQVLQSRSLLEGVVDSLGLQVQLRAPLRRADVFSDIWASRDARPGEYRLELQGDGFVRVRDGSTGQTLGQVKPGTSIDLRGVRVKLTPAARFVPAATSHDRTLAVSVYTYDEAVKGLQKGLEVKRRSRDANILDINYQGTDPALVRDVPNVLTARFIAGREKERRAQARSTAKFLREQIAKLSAQLGNAEDRLRSFRERRGVVSLPDEASAGVRQVAELQAKRNALEAERMALAGLVRTMSDTMSKAPGTRGLASRNLAAFPTLLGNQAMSQLLSSIAAAEDRRSELLLRRSMRDPDVRILTGRVDQLEGELRGLALTYLQGLTNQVAGLDMILRQSRQQLDRIPSKELQFARLQRESSGLEGIVTQLQSRLKEAEIAEAVEDPSIRLVDVADLPSAPSSPRRLLSIAVALILGLGVGAVAALVWEYKDRTARSRQDVLLATGVSVLGLLPHVQRRFGQHAFAARARLHRSSGDRLAAQSADPQSLAQGATRRSFTFLPAAEPRDRPAPGGTPPAPRRSRGHGRRRFSKPALLIGPGTGLFPSREGYNRLATNLAFSEPAGMPKILTVTSPLPGEGKTTVAVNLAITLAQHGGRVLLLDADLRRGAVAEALGVPHAPGLSEVLAGTLGSRDAIQEVRVSESGRLHLITCGRSAPNPAALLGSHFEPLLGSLREEYDAIVVDTPPVNVVADAAVIGALSDGVIVVARAGVTGVQALAFATEELRRVGAAVIGTVLNDIDFRRDADYDEAYEYYARGEVYAQQMT